MKKETELTDTIMIVSIGRHTRLGDALEYALEPFAFETADADAFCGRDHQNRRLLFAASADEPGENAQMRRLSAALAAGACRLDGSAAAVILDGEQGGAIRIDALRLLMRANGAGCEILPRGCLAAEKALRFLQKLAGSPQRTPFLQYCELARSLAGQLAGYTPASNGRTVRLVSALDEAQTRDWRAAIARVLPRGCTLADEDGADRLLLAENTRAVPEDAVFRALERAGGGRLAVLLASPGGDAELYQMALLERACLQGGYALAPNAFLAFEGLSAAEALASGAEIRRMQAFLKLRGEA